MAQMITAQNITAADVLAGATRDWCYSDAYKEIHGFRPRGHTAEQEASFWNNFDRLWADMEAQEAEQLKMLGERHGREFKNFMAYYDFLEAEEERHYREVQEARRVAQAEREEFFRRNSPQPAIQAWEHGDRLAA